MDLQISYRNLEKTESIDDVISRKVEHLKKTFHEPLEIHWVCSIDGHDQHKSEVHLVNSDLNIHAKAIDRNLYKTFDMAIHKLEQQNRK